MAESNNHTEFDCPPDYTEFENKFLFWVDGVALCSLSFPGLLMNLTAIIVLIKNKSLHNTFNYLLISLFIFDSTYIFTTISNNSFMKQFGMATRAYIIVYPYLMHPLKHISFTSSIFMTVMISYHRYLSITNPIQHYMGKKNTESRRVLIYILSVVLASIIFNIPKFMEAEIEWESLNRYLMRFLYN